SRRLARHRAGNRRAPVAALRDIPGIADALHQFRPRSRNAVGVPTGVRWSAGEAIARQRRDDDVESILGATSVRRWIRKRIDDLELLDDGSRPTMGNDDRQRVRMMRTNMYEVDVDPVDGRHELRKRV